MSEMTAFPEDDPVMVAWIEFKETHSYKNSKRWAIHPEHLEGALWNMFLHGFMARDQVDHAKE